MLTRRGLGGVWHGAAKSGLIPTRDTVVGPAGLGPGTPILFFFVTKSTLCVGRGWEGREAAGCSKRDLTRATVGSMLEMPGKQNRPCLHLHQALSSHSWGSPFPKGVKERFGILPLLSALN